MPNPTATPSQSPDELRAEISQYRIYRNALLAFLGVVAFAALTAVVSTTLMYRAYTSVLVITLWCAVPVLILTAAAFSVIRLRDDLAQAIHERHRALDRIEPGQVPPPAFPGRWHAAAARQLTEIQALIEDVRNFHRWTKIYLGGTALAGAVYLAALIASSSHPSFALDLTQALAVCAVTVLVVTGTLTDVRRALKPSQSDDGGGAE